MKRKLSQRKLLEQTNLERDGITATDSNLITYSTLKSSEDAIFPA